MQVKLDVRALPRVRVPRIRVPCRVRGHVRDIAACPLPCLCLASVLLPFCFRFASVMLVKLIVAARGKLCRETV